MKKYILFVLVLGILSICISKFGVSYETYAKAEEPLISHKQEVYIHVLEFCESSGRDDIKIMDSNNRYSYGCLMFQMETFLREGKKYNLIPQNLTAQQAESKEWIYNCELQEKIAHQILLNGGESNWYNCWKIKLHGTKYPVL